MSRASGERGKEAIPAVSILWLQTRAGLYHLAGDGSASRLEWARAILELDPCRNAQKAREILPARTSDFPAAAARPLMSALNCSKFERTFGFKLPFWRDSLGEALADPLKEDG